MIALKAMIRRNIKLFFKDKALFFTSLITPAILLVLYTTFLSEVFRSSFAENMPLWTPEKLVNATVAGELVSSLIAVSCVTVAFCSNMLIVQDKVSGTINDLCVTPVKKSVLALGYYLSTLAVTLIVCFFALALCLIYTAVSGWYMSFADIMLLVLDIVLLVMFGTALSSIINFFLTSQGQISAVGTIISSGYGFICGAYMPISQFSEGLQKVILFLPGTYGTSLVRNHALAGAFREMKNIGYPAEVIEAIRDSVDCNIYFFGNKVEIGYMYLVLAGFAVILTSAYVIINVINHKKLKKARLNAANAKN